MSFERWNEVVFQSLCKDGYAPTATHIRACYVELDRLQAEKDLSDAAGLALGQQVQRLQALVDAGQAVIEQAHLLDEAHFMDGIPRCFVVMQGKLTDYSALKAKP